MHRPGNTNFPKTSLLPAFVAGFRRVFTMHRPGNTNFPAFFTCCAPTSPKLVSTFMQSDFFNSVCAANASASPPLVKAFAPDFFMAFIAFIGAMAIAEQLGRRLDVNLVESSGLRWLDQG